MAFKKANVNFTHFADGHYRVEITAGDGTIVKRNLAETELDAFCTQHGFTAAEIEQDLATLR